MQISATEIDFYRKQMNGQVATGFTALKNSLTDMKSKLESVFSSKPDQNYNFGSRHHKHDSEDAISNAIAKLGSFIFETERKLEQEFSRQYGPVEYVNIVRQYEEESKIFAFVHFKFKWDAEDAEDDLHYQDMNAVCEGKRLRVDFSLF